MATMMPVMPPRRKVTRKAMAYMSAAVKRIWPPHNVAIQLNILMPVGTPMMNEVTENTLFATGPRPVVNMWWLHTAKPMKPMKMPESTMTGYPNSGLRENVGMISLMTPKAGRMMMYTSG